MSFILDALKKLEQKRQAGSVPDLMTVHLADSQEAKRRSLLPYIIVLVLLINAGILAALLLSGKQDEQTAGPAAVSVQQESAVVENDKKTNKTELHPSSASSEREETLVIEPETSAKEKSAVSDVPSAVTASASVSSPVEEQSAPVESLQPGAISEEPMNETTPAQMGLHPSPQEMEILRKSIKEEYASIDDSPPAEVLTEENDQPVTEKNVPEFDQLPSDVKKELPAISITGHVYSNNPSSRIVNVNGIVIREGDDVSAGLKVEEITVTGVIFDYGGLRFRMRAF